jgi:hypothetical protein
MNNTKNKPIKQDQKKTRQGNATKKQGSQIKYHEQERIETRMFD